MKSVKLCLIDILLALFFTGALFPQDIFVHYCIGKNRTAVEKNYGKPLHIDTSNPKMICMFYQDKISRFIFVADEKGVYQAEVYKSYSSKKLADKDISKIISESSGKGFISDTVSVNDYQLQKPGVRAEIQISENKITSKYDLKIKAFRTEN